MSTTKVLTPVVFITVSHLYNFDRQSFSPVVALEIHYRNSHPIDGVKYTPLGPILPAGYCLMEGRSRTSPEQDRVLSQGRSSSECQKG